MATKDLPVPDPQTKKPRASDLQKSLKEATAALKTETEAFSKCAAGLTSWNSKSGSSIDLAAARFPALVSVMENIASLLDSLKPAQRVKFLREDDSLIGVLFKFLAAMCQAVQPLADDFVKLLTGRSAEDAELKPRIAAVVALYGQVLCSIATAGNTLLRRMTGDGYVYEGLMKPMTKSKALDGLLSGLGLFPKVQLFLKSDTTIGAKQGENVAKLFGTYAELLYTLVQHANDEFLAEFSKCEGPDRLRSLLKASFEHGAYEGYCYLLGGVPPVMQTFAAAGGHGEELFALLREQFLGLSLASEYSNLYPPIILAMRALLSQMKLTTDPKRAETMARLRTEALRICRESFRKKKKVFCCAAYLLFELWGHEDSAKEEVKEIAEDAEMRQHLMDERKNYESLKTELGTIRSKHYDCQQVEASLSKIQKLVCKVRCGSIRAWY